jgi:hypothetical protein
MGKDRASYFMPMKMRPWAVGSGVGRTGRGGAGGGVEMGPGASGKWGYEAAQLGGGEWGGGGSRANNVIYILE